MIGHAKMAKSNDRPDPGFTGKPYETYICPNCENGRLEPVEGSFDCIEPKHSKDAHGHEAWDPDWIRYRFVFKLECTSKTCGEISHAIGRGSILPLYGQYGEMEWGEDFGIDGISPAPLLFHIPGETPHRVAKEIRRSFSLFWPDVSSAATALRISLELLLDEMGIPRQEKKNGGAKRIDLHRRIEYAAKEDGDYTEMFLALKEVGNLGAHGDDVRHGDYHNSIEIMSHVLVQLYENDSKRIKELALKLRDSIKNRNSEFGG